MKFRKEVLQDVLWGDADGYKVVENTLIDTGRWSTHHRLVFATTIDDEHPRYFSTTYAQGATEYQDERPFEYDGEEIECQEVFPVEKTITVYE